MKYGTLCCFALLLGTTPAVATPLYTITDLGTLGGTSSSGIGINSAGYVAGRSQIGGGATHAFLWNGSSMQDLGTLGGPAGFGWGINNAGWVAGESSTSGGASHAFLWNGTTMLDLGTLGGVNSFATGINSTGYVTGASNLTGSFASHAFRWDGTTMQDLGTLGGSSSSGFSINGAGAVSGASRIAGNAAEHAFLWNGIAMQDLGTLGGTNSFAFGINASGQVAGRSQMTGNTATHAFLWNGSLMQDLGTLGGTSSQGYGLNDAGLVVGYANNSGGQNRAFLWDGAQMHDLNGLLLNGSGWLLSDAWGINNSNQITGTGWINGQTHAFLLTPVNNVPEPSTWTLAALGLACAFLRRGRTKGQLLGLAFAIAATPGPAATLGYSYSVRGSHNLEGTVSRTDALAGDVVAGTDSFASLQQIGSGTRGDFGSYSMAARFGSLGTAVELNAHCYATGCGTQYMDTPLGNASWFSDALHLLNAPATGLLEIGYLLEGTWESLANGSGWTDQGMWLNMSVGGPNINPTAHSARADSFGNADTNGVFFQTGTIRVPFNTSVVGLTARLDGWARCESGPNGDCSAAMMFGNTARLGAFRILDSNGDPVAGGSITSDSGHDYSAALDTGTVPEPTAHSFLAIGLTLVFTMRRVRGGSSQIRP